VRPWGERQADQAEGAAAAAGMMLLLLLLLMPNTLALPGLLLLSILTAAWEQP